MRLDSEEPTASQDWRLGLTFVLIAAAVCHLAFSWMGFNPTDDGFFLAQSRRILSGQIPHRDFISMRPPGTAILHAPIVAIGGDYTLWLSRFAVWVQLATMGWCWTSLMVRLTGVKVTQWEQIALALIAFCLSTHIWPLMAWPTVDGLWFISMGLSLASHSSDRSKMVGYFLVGLAYLCKQGFAFVAPISILVMGDWKRLRCWIAGGLPVVIYVGLLALFGLVDDAWMQMSTASKLFQVIARQRYAQNHLVLWGVVVGLIGAWTLQARVRASRVSRSATVQRVIGTLLLLAPIYTLASRLTGGVVTELFDASLILFGAAFGAMVGAALTAESPAGWVRAAFLALLAGWAASISLGYNAPILASGALAGWLLLWIYQGWQESDLVIVKEGWVNRALMVICVAVLVVFAYAREEHIYRELPGRQLTHDLGEVLPGGKLIRTNENVYNLFAELGQLVDGTEGTHIVAPGVAVWWIRDPQPNPMPLDWWHRNEQAKFELRLWMQAAIDDQHEKSTFLLEKYNAGPLGNRLVPFDEDLANQLPGYTRVRQDYAKVGESDYFEVFR